jgi:hypothetical protein
MRNRSFRYARSRDGRQRGLGLQWANRYKGLYPHKVYETSKEGD